MQRYAVLHALRVQPLLTLLFLLIGFQSAVCFTVLSVIIAVLFVGGQMTLSSPIAELEDEEDD